MKTLDFQEGSPWLLDQTALPRPARVIACRDYRAAAEAIRLLRVRGAPAIGLAAPHGVVLAAHALATGLSGAQFTTKLHESMADLRRMRATAVSLGWALERMHRGVEAHVGEAPDAVCDRMLDEAHRMLRGDEAVNRSMGCPGAALIPDGANILTHCNTGALATAAYVTPRRLHPSQ